MSTSLKIDNDFSFDVEQLLQIVTTCKELIIEKEMLRESQHKSAELIRRLEMDVKCLSEARLKDLKYVQELEEELRNCSKKIGYLQDQLNLRNIEANCLGEHVHSLELKLAEVGKLQKKVNQLNEEVVKSNLDHFFLMRELETKDVELQNSTLCIEKMEETLSSLAMESQCEIESIRLDLLSLEQRSLETQKFQEERNMENAIMADESMKVWKTQLLDSQKMIECLQQENKKLKEKLGILEEKDELQYDNQPSIKPEFKLPTSKEFRACEEVPVQSILEPTVGASRENLKDEMEEMLNQIREYELLVKQLKDELREEKSRSKEEAEDLTQEMAELRYQITGMLEEECKRRSSIEQASLQRIAELEDQVQNERRKFFIAARNLHQVQKLAESSSLGADDLKRLLQELCSGPLREELCICRGCKISGCSLMGDSNGEPVDVECVEETLTGGCTTCSTAALPWKPGETHTMERESMP